MAYKSIFTLRMDDETQRAVASLVYAAQQGAASAGYEGSISTQAVICGVLRRAAEELPAPPKGQKLSTRWKAK